MFGKSERPWKKWAKIERISFNSGEDKFKTSRYVRFDRRTNTTHYEGSFYESLTDAEDALDVWFKDWWPKQIKHTRRA